MALERNAVVMLAYDQVPEQSVLTVQTIETIFAQDIGPLDLLLIDNGSTQIRTWEHFQMLRELYVDRNDETRIHLKQLKENRSPVWVLNRALDYIWGLGHEKVLGVPNDVMLPPNCYRLMNEWPRGLVTGSETRDQNFTIVEHAEAVSECTPAAVALIRKWFYDALVAKDGYFQDEGFFCYASDCDFAVRMTMCGLRGIQLNLPYWHYGSAHWKLLSQEEGRKQTMKADADRAYFERKYGFKVDSWEYGNIGFNFQGKAKAVGA